MSEPLPAPATGACPDAAGRDADWSIGRRGLFGLAGAFGLQFLPAPAAAATAGRKLVVIICRGALDGLSLLPPVGDPRYAELRGGIALPAGQVLPVDATFGLHPSLPRLHALLQAGRARIAPAAAIPVRLRSHFEAQDILETGTDRLYGAATGWLNRALASQPPGPRPGALAVGAREPLILQGQVQVGSWSPGGRVAGSLLRTAETLQELYRNDPLLGPALTEGLRTQAAVESLGLGPGQGGEGGLALTVGRMMAAEGGPAITVASLGGFDTHANQGGVTGTLANRLRALDEVLGGLQDGLGAAWARTAVVVATEFGRTARLNGTGGTDHGTASTLVLAGGAVRPGGFLGDWPGLAEGALFEARDLAPTLDIRRVFKGLLAAHLGFDRRALDQTVFPGSAGVPPLDGLVG